MTKDLLHCQHTRTIVFVRNGAENVLPVNDFVNWLKKYNEWFKGCVLDGNRLYYLYSRSINLSIRDLLVDEEYLYSLGNVAKDLGFGVLVHLQASEILNQRLRFTRLCESGFTSTVFIDGRKLAEPIEMVTQIMHLLDQKIGLIVFGNYADWRNTGLFESPKLNATTFSFISSQKPEFQQLNKAQNRTLLHLLPLTAPMRLLPENAPQLLPPHEFDPCASRMQMTVTEDGLIYPCQGAVGEPSLCFGTIDDEPGNLVSKIDMSQLINQGPLVKLNSKTENYGLPDVCAAHRISLMATSSAI